MILYSNRDAKSKSLQNGAGTILADTGFYKDIAWDGQRAATACAQIGLNPRRTVEGGHIEVGVHGNLVVLVYQPGSEADDYITATLAAGNPVVAGFDENSILMPEAVHPPPVTGETSDAGSDNTNNRQPDTATTGGGTGAQWESAPQCNQFCYGPNNLCSTDNGCKCIADEFQGPGVAYFTGICKYTYAAYSNRRNLLGTDLNSTETTSLLNMSSIDSTTTDLTVLANVTDINSTLAAYPSDWVAGVEVTQDSGVPCPCNCTYVSYACCGSTTGIIYEPPQMRLGAIRMPAGMICNETTGEAQKIS